MEVKPSAYSAGVFRAYATQLNNVASDGAGRNSPFTKALLKHIGTKGIIIQELMIRVRKSVMEETRTSRSRGRKQPSTRASSSCRTRRRRARRCHVPQRAAEAAINRRPGRATARRMSVWEQAFDGRAAQLAAGRPT